jgi:hypothetical protein
MTLCVELQKVGSEFVNSSQLESTVDELWATFWCTKNVRYESY